MDIDLSADILLFIALLFIIGFLWLVHSSGGPGDPTEWGKREVLSGNNDQQIHEAASIANQRDSGRERGGQVVVHYDRNADYSTWRHAAWIRDNGGRNDVYLDNPGDVEASDEERQRR